jgi:uncharacterized protein (DUF1330 family)
MGLDIEPEPLARFLEGDEGPVVLVNLVRLRPGGESAYERYRDAITPAAARHGAELVYVAPCVGTLIGDDEWDLVVLTRYPSRSAIADLVADPEFEAAKALRHEALADGILYASA